MYLNVCIVALTGICVDVCNLSYVKITLEILVRKRWWVTIDIYESSSCLLQVWIWYDFWLKKKEMYSTWCTCMCLFISQWNLYTNNFFRGSIYSYFLLTVFSMISYQFFVFLWINIINPHQVIPISPSICSHHVTKHCRIIFPIGLTSTW